MKQFPQRFYWGAATSAFQVEGGPVNSDWEKAAQEGKVPHIGQACDHYHRYKEDFDIAESLGHNAHRFSIEWARIEPEEGIFDEKEIEHYRDVLRALRARGLEPFVTLWHFSLPTWFSENGGWKRKDAPDIFARYCAYVVSKLGDLATRFTTMNEPNSVIIPGYIRGTWPPFKKWPFMALVPLPMANATQHTPETNWLGPYDFFYLSRQLARGHNRAYTKIKEVNPDANVSLVFQVFVWEGGPDPFTKLAAKFQSWLMNISFMNRVYRSCDSIGVNHYFYRKIGSGIKRFVSDTNWELYSDKIYEALMLMSRYKKPLFVSEVGVADARDRVRAEYITTALRNVHRAIEEGVRVEGFLYWSLLDNYELALGYEARFGLVEINYVTLERTIRPSAQVYAKICRDNAVE